MKHVTKAPAPESFEAWKDKANADWQPTYPELQNPEKRDLHTALLAEQGGVCCYCGRTVGLQDSHIEHFRPQGEYNKLDLDYGNLHASCIRESKPGLPLHCGHAKAGRFDETLHISPLEPTCERRFMYTLLGELLPADTKDRQASYMVDLLDLGNPSLRSAREEVLRQTLDIDFLTTATAEELARLGEAFRRRDGEGKLPGFGHVVARYAEQLVGPAHGESYTVVEAVENE